MQLHKNLVIATQLLCETLPISSSTHAWLVDFFWKKFYPSDTPIVTEHLMDLLFLPTLVVLGFFFRHHIKHLGRTLILAPRSSLNSPHYKRWWMIMIRLAGYLATATIVFAATYLGLRGIFKSVLTFPHVPWTLPFIGLCITMILQASLFFVPITQDKESALTLKTATLIGFFQGFGAIPGISRLNTTLAAARWLNISPHRAFEFSALLQVVTFAGNIIKNCLCDRCPAEWFSYGSYKPILEGLTWDSLIVAGFCAVVSYFGLIFTQRLNSSKTLWKFSPYFALPLSLLWLYH